MKDWYNKHIVAGWYKSWAIWVGAFAAAFPYLIDMLEAAVQQWPAVAEAVRLTPLQTSVTQVILLVVVLPIARAWRQTSMQTAALAQAVVRGDEIVAVPKEVVSDRA